MNAKSVYIIIICLQEHQITNQKKNQSPLTEHKKVHDM